MNPANAESKFSTSREKKEKKPEETDPLFLLEKKVNQSQKQLKSVLNIEKCLNSEQIS